MLDSHSVISHAKVYKTNMDTTMKTTIDPNKTTASFIKFAAVIVGSFVALYTTAIDAANGSSHSIELGFVPTTSESTKPAIATAFKSCNNSQNGAAKSAIDISVSGCLCTAQMSQVNSIDNA